MHGRATREHRFARNSQVQNEEKVAINKDSVRPKLTGAK
jgi:hypothetical protein